MPTAVLYADLEVDLFSYIAKEKQTPTVEVFYAIHRQRQLISDCDVIVMQASTIDPLDFRTFDIRARLKT